MSSFPSFSHERVEIVTGARSGLTIAAALHSSVLGPALGGTRLWTYAHWSDALADVLRLSSAMTLKNAAAGLDTGGGKAVIALEPGAPLDADRRRAAYLDLGDLVETFGGLYTTTEDVGSTMDDMLTVSERTSHVVGLPGTVGGSGEPAIPTSIGVYQSLLTTVESLTGSRDLRGQRATISGLGQVGSQIAQKLAADGAHLVVTDVNPARQEFASELGATWVEPGTEHLIDADLFIPAGIGGILTDEVIDSLAARAVCGPANNPLADPSGATKLAERGVLYAPDFIVNAGGVIHLDGAAKQWGTPDEVLERVTSIGDTLRRVYQEAEAASVTPLAAAEQLAAERLSTAAATVPGVRRVGQQ